MSNESASVAASESGKPRLVQLFEAFLKLEHLRGRTAEAISSDVQDAVRYLADKHLRDKLSTLDSLAATRFIEFVNQSIIETVGDALNSK